MATANDRLQDILVTHAVGIERLKAGMVSRAQQVLDEAERNLLAIIREVMEDAPPGGRTATRAQLRQLDAALKTIRDQRAETWAAYREQVRRELREFAEDEAAFSASALKRSIALAEIEVVAPTVRRLRTATEGMPFQGRLMGDWFADLEAADQDRLLRSLRQGWVNGETVDDIVARVRGTRAARFSDGALGLTRRQAESVVRTAVTHFAAATHEEVWQANVDIVTGVKWVSVLDGRTTPICQDRDGRIDPLPGHELPEGALRLDPPGARPPAHVNCRSVTIAVLGGQEIVGERPFVTDTRNRRRREIDFRRQAREDGISVAQARRAWADANIGQVSAEVRFEDWLRTKSAVFQDDLLGPTRGKLFRTGGLTLDRFVDHTGRRYTLAELRVRDAEAFRAAGL
jgi:SPP1 gp7 family putative phage head morphogenesis protein